MDAGNTKTWEAELTPHRSLSKRGFLLLMILVIMVNLVVGASFAAIGAWPVAGFAGLDILIVWWAFRANFHEARRIERIRVTEHELVVERQCGGNEPEQQRFVRRWTHVEFDEDRERGLIGRLMLVSGRSRLLIGEFLAPEERKALATALSRAIAIPHI
jgi:uncharacterized membrane protein